MQEASVLKLKEVDSENRQVIVEKDVLMGKREKEVEKMVKGYERQREEVSGHR